MFSIMFPKTLVVERTGVDQSMLGSKSPNPNPPILAQDFGSYALVSFSCIAAPTARALLSRLLSSLYSSDKSMIAAPSTRVLLLSSHLRASCRLFFGLVSFLTTTLLRTSPLSATLLSHRCWKHGALISSPQAL
ncbi:hypothetical protein CDL15_Pgr019956 [Punica granatum]|uniref:Uncharacterized protein n=1 Tax=Punica granatum TaxID=22663 RepID=A0A218VRY3_PUNGR|nr:hypothetical protein CDL15_Pgr019956 [Punica granatum]